MINVVFEVLVLAKHCLVNDMIKEDARTGDGFSFRSVSQPRDFQSLLEVLVVQVGLGIDGSDFSVGPGK
jgi:hypothetical protein